MLFANDHDCLVIRSKHRIAGTQQEVLRSLRFWAENGLVHCEDSLDNSYDSFSVAEFLRRVSALSDMANNRDRTLTGTAAAGEADAREKFLAITEKALTIARKAREQGMPDDPSAVRDRVRRKPTTVTVRNQW